MEKNNKKNQNINKKKKKNKLLKNTPKQIFTFYNPYFF